MIPTGCTRDDCLLGQRRVRYERLCREYRCNGCGGRPTVRRADDGSWYPACGRCDGRDFIHDAEWERQGAQAIEVLDGLPPELRAALTQKGDARC